MKASTLEALLAARGGGRAVVLATDLEDGSQTLVFPGEADEAGRGAVAVAAAARAAARDDASREVEVDGRRIFLCVYNPPPRLIVVGAVHIAQPLARMAGAAGFDVVVVDPRRAFATEERFPGVRLVRAWPEEAFGELAPDARTAVVTLTHDPKLDDPALMAALSSDAFHIGALGSRRTHARRVARLEEAGFDAEAIGRVHGPVGLDIGARTPEEIAVSILAGVVAALRAAR